VPDWIKVKPIDTEKEKEDMMNLGKRVRKTIMNIDNLSEQQFLRAVEEGEDLQEVMKRVQARREQRVAMGLPMYSDDDMDEDDYGQEQYEVSVKKQASIKRQLEQ
jgi:hypothetical protein